MNCKMLQEQWLFLSVQGDVSNEICLDSKRTLMLHLLVLLRKLYMFQENSKAYNYRATATIVRDP